MEKVQPNKDVTITVLYEYICVLETFSMITLPCNNFYFCKNDEHIFF